MDWTVYAWVKRGSRRKEILQLISKSRQPLTANEIKNNLKISLSQISLVIKELSEKQLITCLNPEDKIGKIYTISEKGEGILREI